MKTSAIGKRALVSLLSLFVLAACSTDKSMPTTQALPELRLNQVGYLPQQPKYIVVTTSTPQRYIITQVDNNDIVLTGTTGEPQPWALSGDTTAIIDASAVTKPGLYRVSLSDHAVSATFRIDNAIYSEIHDASIKAYYFNRAGLALDPAYAGKWQRPMGHPDNSAIVLSAPEQTKPSAKGWYDAGDYNKYIVNSGISTYTLMRAYLDFPDYYHDRRWNIPESSNNTPDMLDEIAWNLEWMLTMQDSDGGVYHKLTTLHFSGDVMPHETTAQRYFTAKGTAATLNFAAVMAVAARVYPDDATQYIQAATNAWLWAQANPAVAYKNEENVHTGEYGDNEFTDEFAWAAAELFITTKEKHYLTTASESLGYPSTPSWGNTTGLGYVSLLQQQQTSLPVELRNQIVQRFIDYADVLVAQDAQSPYRIAMRENDFVWGSNGVAMNHAMILAVAYQQTQDKKYLTASFNMLDYVLGRNPTGYSYVTGFGSRSPLFIHHRQSRADNVAEPVPGFLVGGPQNGHQDQCQYDSNLPATSYLDNWCSYSTNEVTINWNAPLVYALAALQNL